MEPVQTIKINVGGRKFQTTADTLSKYPDTLLGKIVSSNEKVPFRKDEEGYIFFDRNGDLFNYILDYYRNGKIIRPTNISRDDFIGELDFWGIEKLPKKNLDEIVNSTAFLATLTVGSHCEKMKLYKIYLVVLNGWMSGNSKIIFPCNDVEMLTFCLSFKCKSMSRVMKTLTEKQIIRKNKDTCSISSPFEAQVVMHDIPFDVRESDLIVKDNKTQIQCLEVEIW